jgi:hypothetical protein
VLVLLALVLAACSPDAATDNVSTAPDLESAAIERGLVRDPDARSITGLYARDTDRVCIVPDGGGHRIGAFVDYGDGIGCSASGRASQAGERLRIDLGDGCEFEARFDGERVTFPAIVPGACARRCTRRASLAALTTRRLSDSVSEGRAMRDGGNRLLCRTT